MQYIITLLIILSFTGCFSSYPMNLSATDYEQLSLQEMIVLQQKQAELDTKIRVERLKNEREFNRYKHELALKESKRVEKLYSQNNEKLYVSINDGKIKYIKDYFIAPFVIVPYEVKRIKVYRKNRHQSSNYLWVSFQPEGLYLGLEPPRNLRHLNQFVSSDIESLLPKYQRAYVIPRNRNWYKQTSYKVSFKSNLEAKSILVTTYLQEHDKIHLHTFN